VSSYLPYRPSMSHFSPTPHPRALRCSLAGLALAALTGLSSGCAETDAWLWDPSKVGRWEYTPTKVPILSRISSIEGEDDGAVQYTEPTNADLIPEIVPYRIGAGDVLEILVYDLFIEDRPEGYSRIVDQNGFIEIPQLGQIDLNRKTIEEAKAIFMDRMKDLTNNPIVDISVVQRSQLRFHVLGSVREAGTYFIPTPSFKLLDAIASAQGASEEPDFLYVIRQIPLTEAAAGGVRQIPTQAEPEKRPDVQDVIEGIFNDMDDRKPEGQPAVFSRQAQPERPPIDLPDSGARPGAQPGAMPQPTSQPGGPQPAVPMPSETPAGDSTWVFLNGEWVMVPKQRGAAASGSAGTSEPVITTQRVIRIPMKALLSGDARYNIIIRADDVIRVPTPPDTFIYMTGEVARPGSYSLANRLTLTRAIDAAGGLSAIAIPERVDLVRQVGTDYQAIVRVNLRAINEGTQPDFYLKTNDRINVGTNFWATPLAIIRNGFRTTYGFGFLLDRNFSDEVFGDGNQR
jgi:polysaccharide biosynthesis/export protein